MGKKTEMLYLSSSLPALLSISSIFRSNKTILPTSILPDSRDTGRQTGQQAPAAMARPRPAQNGETHHLWGSQHSHGVTQIHVCKLLQLSAERRPPWAYEILPVALTTHGELWHCLGENGENVPATSSSGGPTLPLTVSKPATELLLSVNRGKNIPRMPRTNEKDQQCFLMIHSPHSKPTFSLILSSLFKIKFTEEK